MTYLGSERVITNSFSNHVTAEDYAGPHLSNVSIKSTGKVIKVINRFTSHEDSINYHQFLKNQTKWKDGNYYNCISIIGKTVKMSSEDLGGNQIHLQTIYNNKTYLIKIMHLNDISVNVGDLTIPNQVIAHQGNTGLVLSNKNVSDPTYGSHVPLEIIDSKGIIINPRDFATGTVSGTYLKQSNEINTLNNQIKILVEAINIREQPSVASTDIGNVYFNEIYDVLGQHDSDLYTWYNIKTSTGINGFVAANKDDLWIEYIPKVSTAIDEPTEHTIPSETNNLELLFTCPKEDYYYLKLYKGESLYVKKQD